MIAEQTELTFDQPAVMVAAAVVAVLATARMVHLVVDDTWPPMLWLRRKMCRHLPEDWHVIFECPWCASPYIAAVNIGWGWASGLHWTWWLSNSIAALSFCAAWINLRDVPPDQRE